MTSFVFEPPAPVTVPTTDGRLLPVRRVLCIGKNYADHVREMGDDPKTTPPVFFTKPADAVIVPTAQAPGVPYPQATENLHYEGEIVLALKGGGRDLSVEEAEAAIYGAGLGCDLTRRDLQHAAKSKGMPWDMAKGFDHSAVMGAIMPGTSLGDDMSLKTRINGEVRQQAVVGAMIWPPAEIVAKLSHLVELKPGDLIFTGTPEGVGPLCRGDKVEIAAGHLPELHFDIV